MEDTHSDIETFPRFDEVFTLLLCGMCGNAESPDVAIPSRRTTAALFGVDVSGAPF